jgi:branched-subunit amino acid aminotransferase/4-amino-4-deoxychorismate lyase
VDAVFATNAATGIRPVTAIDAFRWPDRHPILDVLRTEYASLPTELL